MKFTDALDDYLTKKKHYEEVKSRYSRGDDYSTDYCYFEREALGRAKDTLNKFFEPKE